jgi:hypothetical protein
MFISAGNKEVTDLSLNGSMVWIEVTSKLHYVHVER